MKRLLNFGSVVVAFALIAFATTLRSHSPSDDRSALTTGSASAKKSHGRRWRQQASGR